MKLKTCYDLQSNGSKFVTEAVRNTKDKKGKERRVDIVDLSSGKEFEIETNMKRASRFLKEKEVIIIPCGWSKTDKKWLEIVKNG